jgi:hypothetical protein
LPPGDGDGDGDGDNYNNDDGGDVDDNDECGADVMCSQQRIRATTTCGKETVMALLQSDYHDC